MNQSLTPEEYQQLLDLGGQNEEAQQLMVQQQRQAQGLRQGNRPQMRNAGNMNVAPHWLELAGGLAKEYQAGKLDKGVAASTKEQAMRKQQQNAMMLRALMGQQQQAPQGTGPGMMLPGMKPPGPRFSNQWAPEGEGEY